MKKESIIFPLRVGAIHLLTYLIVGAAAYPLFTRQFYVGGNPIFTMFLRSESNPLEWQYVMRWIFPGQILRGLLIGLALLPFASALKQMNRKKRIWSVALLMYITISMSAGAPSPSNIEGLIYMKPEIISLKAFLLTQPEMIIYSLVFAIGVSFIVEGKFLNFRQQARG